MKERLYIAYGSNLNIAQMKVRCPTAKLIGTSIVKDYELVFRGVATIEKKIGSRVPVAVWKLKKEDERSLDIYEGYPHYYEKENFEIDLDGKKVKVMAYVMTPGSTLRLPSEYYYNTIYEGYQDNGLDVSFLTEAVNETKKKIEENKQQKTQYNMRWRW